MKLPQYWRVLHSVYMWKGKLILWFLQVYCITNFHVKLQFDFWSLKYSYIVAVYSKYLNLKQPTSSNPQQPANIHLHCKITDVQLNDYTNTYLHKCLYKYRIASFCHKDFNVVSHGIRNLKIRYIFISWLFITWDFVTASCYISLYFSISLRSKWGLFQTLKEHYLMHESIRNFIVLAIGIYYKK